MRVLAEMLVNDPNIQEDLSDAVARAKRLGFIGE